MVTDVWGVHANVIDMPYSVCMGWRKREHWFLHILDEIYSVYSVKHIAVKELAAKVPSVTVKHGLHSEGQESVMN